MTKKGATGLAGIAKDMRNAIVGPSTNTTLFFNALNKIPSLFIFKQVESIYNKTYTSNLLNDIDGEAALGGMYPSNVLTDPSGALKGLQNSVKQIIFAKPMY
jgi:hypothetical protein